MNDNEYGGFSYNLTDDGKKELRVSDKDNFDDVVNAFRESNLDPNVKDIDQIVITAGGEKRENTDKGKSALINITVGGKKQENTDILRSELLVDCINYKLGREGEINAERDNPNARPLHLGKITKAVIVILGLIIAGVLIYCKFSMV